MARLVARVPAGGSPITACGRAADSVLGGPRAACGVPDGARRGSQPRARVSTCPRCVADFPCGWCRHAGRRSAHLEPAGRARRSRAHGIARAFPRCRNRCHEWRAGGPGERPRARTRATAGNAARHGARGARPRRRVARACASVRARRCRRDRPRGRGCAALVHARSSRLSCRRSRSRRRAVHRRGDDPGPTPESQRLARGRHFGARPRVARVRRNRVRVLRVLGLSAGRVRGDGPRGGRDAARPGRRCRRGARFRSRSFRSSWGCRCLLSFSHPSRSRHKTHRIRSG